jgi:hypothetical protein
MVNNKFDKPSVSDASINPYDRDLWPLSLQNVLMPLYLGEDHRFWVCPAAVRGWPRNTRAYQMTYRDAGANQPNGTVPPPSNEFIYDRVEHGQLGFLDGRPMTELRVHYTGNVINDALRYATTRGTYLRDFVERDKANNKVIGPHNGGINVINREFGVVFRDGKEIQADLVPNGGSTGVKF